MPSPKQLIHRLVPEWYRAAARRRVTDERFQKEIEEHPDRAMVVRAQESSPELFYVFQGRGMAMMMDPLTVLKECGLLRVNLVLLRDYYRFFYHAGLNRHIPDVDAVTRTLAEVRDGLTHVQNVNYLGTSAGGYAAILFGHRNKADMVYAFAPQTLLNLRKLRRLTRRKDTSMFPEEHVDLAKLLANHNGVTRYRVFYCEGHARDRKFAERIAHLPGVELLPQPGDTHLVIQEMYKRGELKSMLPTAAAESARSAPDPVDR